MKVKTSDLIGPALDWAVATIEGYGCQFDDEVSGPWLVPQEGFLHDEKPLSKFSPSTNWNQGGPIIERENFTIERNVKQRGCAVIGFHEWYVSSPENYGGLIRYSGSGPTPLIAAMRCYCCAKLGEYVDIPEELCQRANS